MTHNVNVVILAAGLGTRMKSQKAKVLHEAGGDTILNHVIRAALHVAPPENIVTVVGYQSEQVRASVSIEGIRYAEQLEQKGTGHALLCAADYVSSRENLLVILNGDGPLLRSQTLKTLIEKSESATGGALVTTKLQDPTGYGRIIRDEKGMVAAVIEQKVASPEQLLIREVNPGAYAFTGASFWNHIGEVLPNDVSNEYYLTDMVEILRRHGYAIAPLLVEDQTELLGINTRLELAAADRILRARKAEELMLSGITIENPESVTIDFPVEIAPDTVIEANVQLRGRTRIGAGCRIGTGSVLRNCSLADNVTIHPYVVAEGSNVARRASLGPFARLRMEDHVGEGARVGNFVELKKTKLGAGSKAQHLAYLGDSSIGNDVNIGAGTITCNYDGRLKHRTTVSNGAFVGSNSTLVAPVEIGSNSYVGAGSVITEDVQEDALALGRARQVSKEGWAKRKREKAEPPAAD
jgi:bifunctional UDP-N-acetylglucosamine pyrophosphorylase / glucosamine-1-phosphate N-acetyltransferase